MSEPVQIVKIILEIDARFAEMEARIAALEASKPEPLTFPPIDLGELEGLKQ